MIIIDSNAICHAAKYMHGDLKYKDLHTGVVYGFFLMLIGFYKKFKDPTFSFGWDSSKSERRRIFPTYKIKRSTREKTPEEIVIDEMCYPQFTELRKVILPHIGWQNNFFQVGYEGDDVMASILLNNQFEITPVMVSDDQDMFMMLDHCSIYLRNKRILLTRKMFVEEYGITPRQWIDVKRIGGCKGDEVPGVPGVAEITAIKYILGKLPRKTKKYQDIEANKELIDFNDRLVNIPIKGTKKCLLVDERLSYDNLIEVFEEYGFNTLLKKKREWQRLIKDANSEKIDNLLFR